MKRLFFAALALAFMVSLQPQPAHAQDNSWNTFWTWINHGQDSRLTVVVLARPRPAHPTRW